MSNRPSTCHIASLVCSATLRKPSSDGDVPPVGQQPAAVHAAGPARAGVGPLQRLAEPLPGAQHREGEGQQVVAERGRLRVLQVGLVGHQRVARAHGPARRARPASSAVASIRSVRSSRRRSRKATRTASRRGRPGVQPARHVADLADEVPLARVVRLAVGRVVGELGWPGCPWSPAAARAGCGPPRAGSPRSRSGRAGARCRPGSSPGAGCRRRRSPARTRPRSARAPAGPRAGPAAGRFTVVTRQPPARRRPRRARRRYARRPRARLRGTRASALAV